MPQISCEILVSGDSFTQDIHVPQEFYDVMMDLESKLNIDDYQCAICPLYEALYDNEIKIFNFISEFVVAYSAIFLADGTYYKEWAINNECSTIDLCGGGINDISFSVDLLQQFKDYLKVIQWKCSERIIKMFDFQFHLQKAGKSEIELKRHRKNKLEMHRLAREHNKQFPLTYEEWDNKAYYRTYSYIQYKRDFEERIKSNRSEQTIIDFGKQLQDEWVDRHNLGSQIISERDLMDLIRLLNKELKEISSKSIKLTKEVDKLINGEEEKLRKFGNSVYTCSVPMGGQGTYKRRIRRK